MQVYQQHLYSYLNIYFSDNYFNNFYFIYRINNWRIFFLFYLLFCLFFTIGCLIWIIWILQSRKLYARVCHTMCNSWQMDDSLMSTHYFLLMVCIFFVETCSKVLIAVVYSLMSLRLESWNKVRMLRNSNRTSSSQTNFV